MAQRIRIGELLVKAGVLDDLKLRSALNEQKKWGGQLGKVLIDMGYVDEATMVRALSKQLGLPRADLSAPSVPPDLLHKIDGGRARERGFCPQSYDPARKTLIVAMADPTDIGTIDDLSFRTGLRVEATIAGETALSRAIDLLFFGRSEEAVDLEAERSFAVMSGTEQGPFSEIDPGRLEGEPAPLPPSAPPVWGGGAAPVASPPPGGERFGPLERPARPIPAAPEPRSAPADWGEPSTAGSDQEGVGAKLAAAQKRQNRAIRVMLDMLIERGVFTEAEFRARLGAARGKTRS